MQRRDILKTAAALAATAALGGNTMAESKADEKNLRVAEAYLAAWQNKDLAGMGERLHADVRFQGPMSETTGKDAFLSAAQRMFPLLQSLSVRHTFARDNHVVAIYDFNCLPPIGVCRTAELITFRDGLIAGVELFFDARPFVPSSKP